MAKIFTWTFINGVIAIAYWWAIFWNNQVSKALFFLVRELCTTESFHRWHLFFTDPTMLISMLDSNLKASLRFCSCCFKAGWIFCNLIQVHGSCLLFTIPLKPAGIITQEKSMLLDIFTEWDPRDARCPNMWVSISGRNSHFHLLPRTIEPLYMQFLNNWPAPWILLSLASATVLL